MANDWVEVCVQVEMDAGELLGMLDDSSVQGAWEEAGLVRLYWPERDWNGDRLIALKTVLAKLDGTNGGEPPLRIAHIPSQDWNQQWAQSVKPLTIGRLVVRPSWEPVALASEQLEIVLDPKQAFGTGHHATTRLLLEWLQREIAGGERVLDVGAGSAILAMAAVRLGARSAIGVECDPVAMECARDYVGDNQIGDRVELLCGTLEDLTQRGRPPVDLVLANIDRQTLLQLADELASYGRAGAKILLSGILLDQTAEIIERFSAAGLACVERREQDGWVALALVQPEPCEGVH
jgi:ribosomal protein L11 methyltransferase